MMPAFMHAILSGKAVWAAAKDADVAEKVQTASIIARKSRVDMEICCGGGADVLGPSDIVGVGGAGDVGDVGNGAMTVEAAGGVIWGSSVSFAGWSTAMSFSYVLRWEVLSTGQTRPPINSKNVLAISAVLQSGLSRKTQML